MISALTCGYNTRPTRPWRRSISPFRWLIVRGKQRCSVQTAMQATPVLGMAFSSESGRHLTRTSLTDRAAIITDGGESGRLPGRQGGWKQTISWSHRERWLIHVDENQDLVVGSGVETGEQHLDDARPTSASGCCSCPSIKLPEMSSLVWRARLSEAARQQAVWRRGRRGSVASRCSPRQRGIRRGYLHV